MDGPGGEAWCDRCDKNIWPVDENTAVTYHCDRCDERLCGHCCKFKKMKYRGK